MRAPAEMTASMPPPERTPLPSLSRTETPRTRLVVIGAGAVGTAVASALVASGRYDLAAVHSRTRASAERAVRAVGAGAVEDDLLVAGRKGDVVFISTTDVAIAPVAAALARGGGVVPGALVVHCSGALTAREVLSPLSALSVAIGSIHPLQTFARLAAPGAPASIASALCAYEGDEEALPRLERIARDMGGTPFLIRPESKPLYHAAAALASNAVVALLSVASGVLSRLGLGPEAALEALLPLVRGTIANLESAGLPGALTGPIARGDADVVRRHLASLAAAEPAAHAAYVALSDETIRVARRKGSLSPAGEDLIRSLVAASAAAGRETAR